MGARIDGNENDLVLRCCYDCKISDPFRPDRYRSRQKARTFSLRSVEIARHEGHVRMEDDRPSASIGEQTLHLPLSRSVLFLPLVEDTSIRILSGFYSRTSRFEAPTIVDAFSELGTILNI